MALRLFRNLANRDGPRAQQRDGGNDASAPLDALGLEATLEQAAGHAEARRFGASLRLLSRALEEAPDEPELWLARGATLFDSGRLLEARLHFSRAAALGCSRPALHLNAAQTSYLLNQLDESDRHIAEALKLEPDSAVAHFGLASIRKAQGRLGEAVASYSRALELDPARVECLACIATCEIDRKDAAAAEIAARRGIALQPDDARCLSLLGMSLMLQDAPAESWKAFERAEQLELAAGVVPDVFVNHGLSLLTFGRTAEAITLYRQGLARNASVIGHSHYGFALLASGRFLEGWRHYDFRWLQEPLLSTRPTFPSPVWSGQALHGKTILIRSEQGAGDLIQFARFARTFCAMGARVLLQVTRALKDFAAGFTAVDRVYGWDESPEHFDYYVHLMSIPRALRLVAADIPANVPYYRTDDAIAATWRSCLDGRRAPRIGFVWAGNPSHQHDAYRSMRLQDLAPLLKITDVDWYSLQKQTSPEDSTWLADQRNVHDLGPGLGDFRDTAAVIEQLDLVIAVDTAVAHLAGALGKPVWLLVQVHAEFRWMVDRRDSPWYPTMRIFRQRRIKDWSSVVDDIRVALRGFLDPAERIDGPRVERSAGEEFQERDRPPSESGLSTVIETRHGIVQCFPGSDLQARVLEEHGEWLEREIDLLVELLPSDATVVEIGSGIGAHGLALARRKGPGIHMLLFEAASLTRQVLAQNIASNRLTGQVTVLTPDSPASAVRGAFIDDLCLSRLDLLKVSARVPATDLLDAADALWRLRPIVFAAVNDDGYLIDCAARLREYGYRTWRMETPTWTAGSHNGKPPTSSDTMSLAVVAVPEEREMPRSLAGLDEIVSAAVDEHLKP